MSEFCSCARRLNSMGSETFRAVAGPFGTQQHFAIYDLGGLDEGIRSALVKTVCTNCGATFYVGQMETLRTVLGNAG